MTKNITNFKTIFQKAPKWGKSEFSSVEKALCCEMHTEFKIGKKRELVDP